MVAGRGCRPAALANAALPPPFSGLRLIQFAAAGQVMDGSGQRAQYSRFNGFAEKLLPDRTSRFQ